MRRKSLFDQPSSCDASSQLHRDATANEATPLSYTRVKHDGEVVAILSLISDYSTPADSVLILLDKLVITGSVHLLTFTANATEIANVTRRMRRLEATTKSLGLRIAFMPKYAFRPFAITEFEQCEFKEISGSGNHHAWKIQAAGDQPKKYASGWVKRKPPT